MYIIVATMIYIVKPIINIVLTSSISNSVGFLLWLHGWYAKVDCYFISK